MNDFYEDTELICEQIFNNDYIFSNARSEFKDFQLYKKISSDIDQNIELIANEYEQYYPGIKKLMVDFFEKFKKSSKNFFELHHNDLNAINTISKIEFSNAHNYRVKIATQYGIRRRKR